MNTEKIRFAQCLNDFPALVSLGKKQPVWDMRRGRNSLSLFPLDDEGYSVRGDRRRLLYKGRRRSHRFTILNGESFEYDCILEREPKSNVVSLGIAGAEKFDFFRQPDFVKDPFLKGSYAVYQKKTLVGEGTGKLCHIHRPKIIDARGRWVWGDLRIADGFLLITIPEAWLAKAKYPVVVDPTVGTTTVGSQTHYDNGDGPVDGWTPFFLEGGMGVNKFVVPQTLQGLATAYVYAYSAEDYANPMQPVLYSNYNNFPRSKKSVNEQYFDGEVTAAKPAGWRSANFEIGTAIASGSSIWFGIAAWWMYLRFDYGSVLNWADCYDLDKGVIPYTFPADFKDYPHDKRVSWYFTFTNSQNHVRTLTQGVTLTDKSVRQAGLNRALATQCKASDSAGTVAEYFRGIADMAAVSSSVFRGLLIFIKLTTFLFVRDFISFRLLKMREGLTIKSPVTRELVIESELR